jgi:NAD(P)-dependent dehydrogenase (short-subunit alcohol dehydrogenase family)
VGSRLEGKVAIVTGAASGIGAATAAAMAREGAVAVVADVNLEGAEAVAARIAAEGLESAAIRVDMGDDASITALSERVLAEYGGIDIVVNNAVHVSPHDGPAVANDAALWHSQMAVNLIGPALLSRCAIPSMIERGGGALVHISSNSALRPTDERTCYTAAKAGLIGLSRAIAVQYGKQGVRSTCIVPGSILTPAAYTTFTPDMLSMLREHTQTPDRLGAPEDIAQAAVFLSSPEAAYITGTELVVDGGLTTGSSMVSEFRRIAARG